MKRKNKNILYCGRGKRLLIASLLVLAATGVLYAGGAQEPAAPTLEIPPQPRQYISPADADGVQDELVLPFSDVVVPGENTVIVEYALTVFDGDGNPVYIQRERQTERRGFFGNIFGGEKPRVEIPESLTWDGRYNVPENMLPAGAAVGDLVPDGDYTYQLSIVDDERNASTSPPFNMTVDNTPPEVEDFPALEYTFFAPNDDGMRDTITFELSGSREVRWVVRIIDEDDTTIFERIYENTSPRRPERDVAPPARFVWDGTVGTPDIDDRPVAPEGEYRLELSGEDRAGNSTTVVHPETVTLSLQAADLALATADGNPRFSPNDNGRRDTLAIVTSATQPEMIERWTIEALFRNQVVRSVSGDGAPPQEFAFDGKRQDGSVLPDGPVQLSLRAVTVNGVETRSAPLTVVIDTAAPAAVATLNTTPEETPRDQPLVFGAGNKTGIAGTIRYERDATWTFRLSLDDQELVAGELAEFIEIAGVRPRAAEQDGKDLIQLAWDGSALVQAGRAPDGRYELVLNGEDQAGNRAESRLIRVIKDARTPEITLTTEDRFVSPLTESPNSEIVFEATFGASERIQEFLFEIRNADGRVIRSEYRQRPSSRFEWTGLTNAGTVAADGDYTADLVVTWQNGHSAEVRGVGPVTVDRTPPRIELLAAQYREFSPTDDGVRDTVRIDQRVVAGDDWTVEIRDAQGETVLTREYRDRVEPFTWDGRDDDGNAVPDGEYRYVLRSVDRAGNRTEQAIVLEVDTELDMPELDMLVEPQPYSPAAEGIDGILRIRLGVDAETTIRGWEVVISDPRGEPFRRFSGDGDPPPTIEWDGRGDDRSMVEAAERYPVSFSVNDHLGNEVQLERTIVIAAFGPPRPAITLQPLPFAPDGDGNNDILEIGLIVETETEIVRWVVEILDPRGRSFYRFSGSGAPPEMLTWDGLSRTGELVQSAMDYPVRFTVRDEEENVVTAEATIATDILVMREAQRLRIRISSIHFAGNTPDLFMSEREKLDENLVTLRRLAQILNRYPDRPIIVEGHAAHVYLQTPESIAREQREELLPLSRRRAEEVIKALIILGVDRDRLSVRAIGGNRPVVPHSDLDNLWKNRRVEFLLDE